MSSSRKPARTPREYLEEEEQHKAEAAAANKRLKRIAAQLKNTNTSDHHRRSQRESRRSSQRNPSFSKSLNDEPPVRSLQIADKHYRHHQHRLYDSTSGDGNSSSEYEFDEGEGEVGDDEDDDSDGNIQRVNAKVATTRSKHRAVTTPTKKATPKKNGKTALAKNKGADTRTAKGKGQGKATAGKPNISRKRTHAHFEELSTSSSSSPSEEDDDEEVGLEQQQFHEDDGEEEEDDYWVKPADYTDGFSWWRSPLWHDNWDNFPLPPTDLDDLDDPNQELLGGEDFSRAIHDATRKTSIKRSLRGCLADRRSFYVALELLYLDEVFSYDECVAIMARWMELCEYFARNAAAANPGKKSVYRVLMEEEEEERERGERGEERGLFKDFEDFHREVKRLHYPMAALRAFRGTPAGCRLQCLNWEERIADEEVKYFLVRWRGRRLSLVSPGMVAPRGKKRAGDEKGKGGKGVVHAQAKKVRLVGDETGGYHGRGQRRGDKRSMGEEAYGEERRGRRGRGREDYQLFGPAPYRSTRPIAKPWKASRRECFESALYNIGECDSDVNLYGGGRCRCRGRCRAKKAHQWCFAPLSDASSILPCHVPALDNLLGPTRGSYQGSLISRKAVESI
ncbi:hypothetical protein QBC35DRAFT_472476 [Podospora australis]|uniref:Uncharacterized protein n=1 Tax=Podospora australis TaxID=1536484 RepID=A0AAN6WXQ8_9PEZI|nr:hypothetical protein QBC35DRAFT_472476 [Podospora australis]